MWKPHFGNGIDTMRRAQRGVPRSAPRYCFSGGTPWGAPYLPLKGYPTGTNFKVGRRMEPRGGHSWFTHGWREGVSPAGSGIAADAGRERSGVGPAREHRCNTRYGRMSGASGHSAEMIRMSTPA